MKNYSGLALFIVILGSFCWFGLPYWWLAIIAGIGGFLFQNSPLGNFFVAFSAGTTLWSGIAWWQNFQNAGLLAGRIGQLLQGLSVAQLIWATGAIGGLLAGFGALTGSFARAFFEPKKKRNYLAERRRR